MVPLDPDSTIPVRENGIVRYVIHVGNEQRKLEAENVFHLKGLGFDGLTDVPLYLVSILPPPTIRRQAL
jgi:hypothetical protein